MTYLDDRAEECVQHAFQADPIGFLQLFEQRQSARRGGRDDPLDHSAEKIFLRSEVIVHRREIYLGFGRDVPKRGRIVSFPGEKDGGDGKDPVFCVFFQTIVSIIRLNVG